ncbi:MAG: glycosyltransferase [Candidatus Symbiothrix sp.]|jgi:glycosyltransferase involved in cell wall biosynthesis|nr:glycosyltransferase [Candidatus Symbiothrix sp.]
MISILIPIYNFPCSDLIKELAGQAQEANVPFEIICIDDCSSQLKEENRLINEIPHCTYIELDKNIGRSRIRNLLVTKAAYEYVLFLDCDSQIPRPDYIQKYVEGIRQYDILSGGRLYEPVPPADPVYYLHWKYGTVREPKPDNHQYKAFTSNNFIIKKSIIETYPFNEKIVRYGHEDSLFQFELEKNGHPIHFIDNPVVHIGLESNVKFLEKTRESIVNLYELYHSDTIDTLDIDKLKLLKTFLRIKKYKLSGFLSFFYPAVHSINNKINLGRHPSLHLLDAYKLTYLNRVFRVNTTK